MQKSMWAYSEFNASCDKLWCGRYLLFFIFWTTLKQRKKMTCLWKVLVWAGHWCVHPNSRRRGRERCLTEEKRETKSQLWLMSFDFDRRNIQHLIKEAGFATYRCKSSHQDPAAVSRWCLCLDGIQSRFSCDVSETYVMMMMSLINLCRFH